jgi:hypothetical protein
MEDLTDPVTGSCEYVQLYEFVIDPQNFAKTIENIHHLSLLVKRATENKKMKNVGKETMATKAQ